MTSVGQRTGQDRAGQGSQQGVWFASFCLLLRHLLSAFCASKTALEAFVLFFWSCFCAYLVLLLHFSLPSNCPYESPCDVKEKGPQEKALFARRGPVDRGKQPSVQTSTRLSCACVQSTNKLQRTTDNRQQKTNGSLCPVVRLSVCPSVSPSHKWGWALEAQKRPKRERQDDRTRPFVLILWIGY